MRLGDDVLMLHRNDRNIDPDHATRITGEIARGGDDVLASNVALVGHHLPLAVRLPLDRRHSRLAVDLAAAVARAPRQRLGEVGRLDVAVLRMLDGADDPLDVAERPDVLDLAGGEELHLDPADRRGDAGVIMVLVEPVAGAGEADVGYLAEADVEAGLLLQRLIEGDGIFVDLPNRVAEVEQRQKPGRMPCRAGGQLPALDQHAVRPALLAQMIQRRDADHAPADHHRPRMRSHGMPSPRFLPPCGGRWREAPDEGSGPKGLRGARHPARTPHPAAPSARPPSPARGEGNPRALTSFASSSIGRVRHRRLALVDEGADRFIRGRIERRRFVFLEHRLPQSVGARRRVL